MNITYQINPTISVEEAREIYQQSGLNRPEDLRKIEKLLENATILITARNQDGKLVGLLRAFTDFVFDCYLNDLAVHRDYQGQGIGKQLTRYLLDQLEHDVMVLLVSAPDAIGFYKKLGFTNFKRVEDTWYKVKR